MQPFADDAIGYFVCHGARSFKASDCTAAKLYEQLQNSRNGTIFNKFIQTFLITSAHRRHSILIHEGCEVLHFVEEQFPKQLITKIDERPNVPHCSAFIRHS